MINDKRLNKIIEIARVASIKSNHHSHKLGSVLFDRKGRVWAVGTNWLDKTHPLIRMYDPHKTVHAEMDAILSVRHKHDLEGMNLLVYREYKNGLPAMAKSCNICKEIMKLYGIKSVYYTSPEGVKKENI